MSKCRLSKSQHAVFFAGFQLVGIAVVRDDNKHRLVLDSRPRTAVGHNCSMPPKSAEGTLGSRNLLDPDGGTSFAPNMLSFDLS